MLVSNKVSFSKKGFKYFIGYKYIKKVRSLRVILPKISAYRRDFDETKYMSFLIKNGKLLETYNKICDKVSNAIKKGFDSELVYNEKYLRTKIKSSERKISTNFRDNEIQNEGCQCICTLITHDRNYVKSLVFQHFFILTCSAF